MNYDEINEALGGAEVVFQSSYDELLEKATSLVASAEQRGREAERAAVVKWLRAQGPVEWADGIEAGKHLEPDT